MAEKLQYELGKTGKEKSKGIEQRTHWQLEDDAKK